MSELIPVHADQAAHADEADDAAPERSLVNEVFAEVFAAPTAMTVDEWADKHRVVVGSDEPGPWRTARTPHIRGPMRTWTDDGIDTIILMFASQQCKTECIFNCLMFDADTDPKWWMFVYPAFEDCKRVNKKRLIPSLRATPRMAEKFAGQRDDATTTEISLGQTEVFFAWTGSDARLKSLPIQRLAEDEIDEFAPGADQLVADRIKASARPKRIRTSTPTHKGMGIDLAYQNSDRRRFERPCPHCRAYREWMWGHVKWGVTDPDGVRRTGSQCTPDEAEASAHVECPKDDGGCGGLIHGHHRAWMNARGVWLREGERIERAGDEDPDAGLAGLADDPPLAAMHLNCPIPGNVRIVGEPVNPSRTAGFRANSLISPFAGSATGKMVRAFADAGYRMTPEFARGWLGEAWEVKGEKVEEAALRGRCVAVKNGGYALGTVPEWAVVLLGAVDVQPDVCHLLVRAYGARGEISGLVWFETIPAPTGGNLVELDPAMARTFSGRGGAMRPAMFAIDTGHRRDEVMEFCWLRRGRLGHVPTMAVKGESGENSPVPIRMAGRDGDHTRTTKGRVLPVPLYLVNTSYFKDHLLGAMADQDRWRLPSNTSDAYLEQVTAEQRVLRTTSVSVGRGGKYEKGQGTLVWVRRPGRRDNHALDCEVYAAAVATKLRIHGLTSRYAGPTGPAPMTPTRASHATPVQATQSTQPDTARRAQGPTWLDRSRRRHG